ncbi:hypothetical protein DW067_08655 [Lachnospira eligens]|nr:hypothetical protein DW067_08655 [Lachnospira eligens]
MLLTKQQIRLLLLGISCFERSIFMSLINKEKVLNGVGKAVDVTNKAADKASSFVKEKKIDKKAMKAAKTAEKGIKIAGNKIGEVAGEIVAGYKSKAGGTSSTGSTAPDIIVDAKDIKEHVSDEE